MLKSSDFKRLRCDAEARRELLLAGIESAVRELTDIEGYLARLEITEHYISASDLFQDGGVGNATEQLGHQLGLPEMVNHVLYLDRKKSAIDDMPSGLKPSEIAQTIKTVFGRDVSSRAVNSHVWYLFRKGRITKVGNRYLLVRAEGLAGNPGGAGEADMPTDSPSDHSVDSQH